MQHDHCCGICRWRAECVVYWLHCSSQQIVDLNWADQHASCCRIGGVTHSVVTRIDFSSLVFRIKRPPGTIVLAGQEWHKSRSKIFSNVPCLQNGLASIFTSNPCPGSVCAYGCEQTCWTYHDNPFNSLPLRCWLTLSVELETLSKSEHTLFVTLFCDFINQFGQPNLRPQKFLSFSYCL